MTIPKIIHFIFFGFTDFELFHYLAVTSAYYVHKPDTIYMYNEVEPKNNFYWESIRKYVTIVPMKAPSNFRGIPLNSYQYKADITRMEKLIEHGGIYLDIDIISLKMFDDDLLHNSCVVGAESGDTPDTTNLEKIGSVTNAVILCEPQNDYIKLWYDKIAENIIGKVWAYHAVCLPKILLLDYTNKENIKLLPKKSFMPFCFRDPYVFDNNKKDRSTELNESYTIHLWETIWNKPHLCKIDINYFITEDNIFVDICRKYINLLCDDIDTLKQIINNAACCQKENINILRQLENYKLICLD